MSGYRLEWHGDEAEKIIRATLVKRLYRAAIVVKTRAKELLMKTAGTGRVNGRKAGPVTRSAPGEVPYKQTGRLAGSVAVEIDEANLTARVGTPVAYGRHLELGTKKGLKPRPWLRRALAETHDRVMQILAGRGE